MSCPSSNKNKIIILKAFKLIYDPTRLLELLYSKYGDIEEDFNSIYINNILYNKSSHYLTLFKESQYNDYIEEFLKRFYKTKECHERLPKLSDYYKNYHLFFCRPVFRNFTLTELMHTYGDNQAEIFYKNNFAASEHSKTNDNNTDVHDNNDDSLSSLDNITNNKTIFDKKTRFLIDINNTHTNQKSTITMTLDSSRINNTNVLYSKRSKNNSFINLIAGITAPKVQNIKVNTNNSLGSHNNTNSNNQNNNKIKNVRMKSSLCTLTKAKIDHFNSNNNFPVNGNGGNIQNNKILLSPKLKPYLTTFKSNISEFNKNRPKINYNNYGSLHLKNKTYFYNGGNNLTNIKKISKLSCSNANKNSIIIMTMTNANGGNLNGGCISKENNKKNICFQTKKNKTYDINLNNPTTTLSKSKGKNNSLTKATNFKSPLSSKTITSANNTRLHPSSSIPKYNHTMTKSKPSSKKNSYGSNSSYNNMLENLKIKKSKYIVQSQRALSSNKKSTPNIKSPTSTRKNTINTNTIYNTYNECVFISRNKKINNKNSIQSIRSSKGKNNHHTNGGNSIQNNAKTTITKSVDEKGIKNKALKSMLTELSNNTTHTNNSKKEHHYQMSQKLINQIEDLIKRAKFGSNSINGKNNGKVFHPIEVNCGTTRGNSMKPINVNLNSNFRMKSSERKKARVVSPQI